MTKTSISIVLISMMTAVSVSFGAPSPTEENKSAPEPAKSALEKKKTTEVSFDDVLVQGKYHFSDEAVTTVEQDKVLDALLGVRTDFKDRLKKSTTRY